MSEVWVLRDRDTGVICLTAPFNIATREQAVDYFAVFNFGDDYEVVPLDMFNA